MKIQITGGIAEIDESDAELILSRSWYADKSGYAKSRINGKIVRMHRLIIGAKEGEHIDHANGNGLDNRRQNLRIVRRNENMWNSKKKNQRGARATSSSFKGVYLGKGRNPWRAEVTKFGKRIFSMGFANEQDAALAYNLIAKREFGEFALLNPLYAREHEVTALENLISRYKPHPIKNLGGCVSFVKSWGKWIFRKKVDGKMKYITHFSSRKEAEAARDAAK